VRGTVTYKTLEVMGPEHEFSLVDEELKPLPIVDKVIKGYCGKTVNFVEHNDFTFGKELQLHVMELKANEPFDSPLLFEEAMQKGVTTLSSSLDKYDASLLGTGMHPLLKLNETAIWSHRHRKIYEEYAKVFNLKQHGWLNIQSFHLNLPYSNEDEGVELHNFLACLCTYLPAISASSPIYEGETGPYVDNRLWFYKTNQAEVPSIVGDVIPEYVASFNRYKEDVIGKYSRDLAQAGVGKTLLFKEWVNSRGVIFRFDRKAIEVRVLDEQECIKSDVALSCFIRATLRGLVANQEGLLSHDILVSDFNSAISEGLNGMVLHPKGKTVRDVCRYFFKIASKNASEDEKQYLWLIRRRIENGNLSELILERVRRKAQKTDFAEAVRVIYSRLIKCLIDNQPYL
jgi:gamma-glutamyl:cysteine ligase YbdK (ATP-grasp superfamily)